MAGQSITSLSTGEVPVASRVGGGQITNKGNIYFAPARTTAVLGDNTKATTGGSPTGGTPTGGGNSGGNSGGGSGISQSDISDAYAPLLSALDSYAGQLNQGYGRDVQGVNDQYVGGQQKTDAESAQLNTDVDTNQRQYNNQLTSAYQDAIRAYNALAQQGNARFGGSSSAGQAVGELANQEFFRQQGNINEQQTEGDLSFIQQRTKIKDYILGKKNDLDNWKNQALSQLKTNLDSALAQIQQQKGIAESNKTKDRLAILQSAQQTADQIHATDIQFRQGLVAASHSL
jgi:hypothetical protein